MPYRNTSGKIRCIVRALKSPHSKGLPILDPWAGKTPNRRISPSSYAYEYELDAKHRLQTPWHAETGSCSGCMLDMKPLRVKLPTYNNREEL